MAQVLIAEDESIIAMELVDALEARGHEVRDASDGQQALEILETFHPDVLVTDLTMPRMDGFELLRRLRDRPGGSPPVIVISALPKSNLPADLGELAYLGKPINHSVLSGMIDRLAGAA